MGHETQLVRRERNCVAVAVHLDVDELGHRWAAVGNGYDASSLPGNLPGTGQQPHSWPHAAADGGGQPGEVSIGQPLVYLKAGQRIARRHAGSLLGTVVSLVADDAAATPPEMSWAALSVSAMFDRAGALDLARVPLDEPEVADALAYADVTTGPDGRPLTFEGRIAEILRRYPVGHPVHVAISRARPELAATVGRVRRRLACRFA